MGRRRASFYWEVLLVIGVTLAFPAAAAAGGAGTAGAVILTQPIGARAMGMSEAYAAADGDVLGIHYNPACGYGRQLALLYQRGLVGDGYGVAAFGWPLRLGRAAVSTLYYSAGEIELVDSSGERRAVNAQRDFLGIFSYAGDVRRLSCGLSLKTFYSRLVSQVGAAALAVDVGGQLRLWPGAKLGLALQNAGPGIKYLTVVDRLPLTWRGGLAWRLGGLIVAADMVRVNDAGVKGQLGLEGRWRRLLILRGGYRLGYDNAGLTGGVGIRQGGTGIDYALAAAGDFSIQHYVGFTQTWGSSADGRRCRLAEAKSEYQRGRYEQALSLLAEAKCDRQDQESAFILCGNAALQLGRREKALEYYRRALQTNPDNGELRAFIKRTWGE